MHLYIDIGNSNIVIGKTNGELLDTYRYNTDHLKSSDEYYAMLKHLFDGVDRVVIASVVPQVNSAFKTFIQRYFDITPLFVGPGIKTGVKLKTDNPKEVGADLVAGAAGAIEHYGENSIVIDMGTATTTSFIEGKEFKGVNITIGLYASKDCLVSKTSQLSQFEFQPPKSVLGTNTIDALNAGLLFGHAFQIIGMVKNIKRTAASDSINVVLTGGASRHLISILPDNFIYDEFLVLKGLIAIDKRNK